MGNIDGKTDKDSATWAKKEGCYCDSYAGRSPNSRCEGRIIGYQPERIDRKDGSFSEFIDRVGTPGGMLRHLARTHREQVAVIDSEITRLQQEKSALKSKIEELESLEQILTSQRE